MIRIGYILLCAVFALALVSNAFALTWGEEKNLTNGKWELFYIDQFGSRGNGDGQFIEPRGLAVDQQGWLYVADSGNCRIQVFDSLGKFLFTFGSFGWEDDKLLYPTDCAVDQGLAIYVIDTDKSVVKKFSMQGMYQGTFGFTSLGGMSSGENAFKSPSGCAVGRDGELLVADTGNHLIHIIDRLGGSLNDLGGFGSGEGFFNRPEDVTVAPDGEIFVADTGNNRIQRFDSQGNYLSLFSLDTEGYQLKSPCQIATNVNGLIAIVDRIKAIVLLTDENLLPLTTIDAGKYGGLASPEGVAIAPDNTIYISDTFNHRILIYRASFVPEE
jgi:DNA-binding beta-propeller fold protein YncE